MQLTYRCCNTTNCGRGGLVGEVEARLRGTAVDYNPAEALDSLDVSEDFCGEKGSTDGVICHLLLAFDDGHQLLLACVYLYTGIVCVEWHVHGMEVLLQIPRDVLLCCKILLAIL